MLIDHQKDAIDRLIHQYKESPNLHNFLRAALREANTLEQVFYSLFSERFIETAEGETLDILGAIVGQSRQVTSLFTELFFGFSNSIGSDTFSSTQNKNSGGRFRSYSEAPEGRVVLSDATYRLFIRARIIKNSRPPVWETIIYAIRTILDADKIEIVESDRKYTVRITKNLTEMQKSLLGNDELIPKPLGINVEYVFIE